MPLTLTIPAGTTFNMPFWVKSSDGTAVDLTGCTARMMLRRQYTSPTPALSLTSSPAAGLTITPLLGRVDILMTEAQTRSLSTSTANDKFVYDVEIVFPSGDVSRPLEGSAIVTPEATY